MKLYGELAEWWPIFQSPGEYKEEAAYFARTLKESSKPAPRSVLELGSGGGNVAYHLKRHFEMTLVDLSPGMLAVSRALNPDLEHVKGDIRKIRLGRTFDAVFVHDAICHMTTQADLRAAMKTAYEHLRPGGVALIVPRSEEHTSELQSLAYIVCRLLLEKKKHKILAQLSHEYRQRLNEKSNTGCE